ADVLSSARPLVPADLATPPQVVDPRAGSASPPPGPAAGAVDSLETLVRGADGLLERARDAARRLAQGDDDEALATLAAFGLPAAVAGDRAAAAPAAQRLVAEVDACVAGSANLTDSAPRLDVLTRATRILLGGPVVLTPALDAAPDVAAGFDPPGAPPPDGLDDWLARLARVRPAIAAFDDLRLFADALGAPSPELKVAQLPLARDEDTWLGGQLPADTSKNALRSHRRPRGPHVHLVIAHPAGADPAAPAAGVVVDELTEVLPAGTETTGVAVHYDAPNARAPQSLLLAVHPDPFNPGVPWSWEMIEAMLEDTLELARFRAVDLDQLDHVGLVEFLPAAYAREGIGTNFKRLIDLHVQEVGLWSHELFAAHRTAGE
ncbi:MAG TPA: hypothetical protein VN213_19225, partial [Solirubrobacteraceae bacterium]|nr:hypothetical protein [Solirubrobacteraceae bacterium]